MDSSCLLLAGITKDERSPGMIRRRNPLRLDRSVNLLADFGSWSLWEASISQVLVAVDEMEFTIEPLADLNLLQCRWSLTLPRELVVTVLELDYPVIG